MRRSIRAFALLLVSPTICIAQDASVTQYQEAMAVCDNMTLYVDAAKRQRRMGMPLNEAKQQTARLMERNLNVAPEVKQGAVELAKSIFDFVYSSEAGVDPTVSDALAATCGSYRGYSLPRAQVQAHIDSTTSSAWDPLARVPVCVKVAQSVANIAVGRDKGLSRERMVDVAQKGLSDDPFTASRLSKLVAWAYDAPVLDASTLYAYALNQCVRERAGSQFPALDALKPRLLECAGNGSQSERDKCTLEVLKEARG